MDAYNGGKIMVRLEREGDSFVFITGQTKKQDISNLISAISELQKNSPDLAKIKEGLLFLDNSGEIDIRKEIRSILQKALENKVVQTGL
jgi:hypothetical protein